MSVIYFSNRSARRVAVLLVGPALAVGLAGCFGDESEDPTPADGVSDALHYAFAAPAWKAMVPCDHLADGLSGYSIGSGVDYVPVGSASTNAVFRFAAPHDSAAMAAPANLKKYPIFAEPNAGTAAFAFGLVMPAASAADTAKLYSRAGLSADSYTEVVAIKYVRSVVRNGRRYASYDVKGRYAMLAAPKGPNAALRPVNGTYCIRFNALSK